MIVFTNVICLPMYRSTEVWTTAAMRTTAAVRTTAGAWTTAAVWTTAGAWTTAAVWTTEEVWTAAAMWTTEEVWTAAAVWTTAAESSWWQSWEWRPSQLCHWSTTAYICHAAVQWQEVSACDWVWLCVIVYVLVWTFQNWNRLSVSCSKSRLVSAIDISVTDICKELKWLSKFDR